MSQWTATYSAAVVGMVAMTGATAMDQTVLFEREPGNVFYRIPSLAVSPGGTILAFASRRKGSLGDFGHDTDVVVRRSTDGGDSWSPVQTIVSAANIDVHHGPAVVDRVTGTVLKFCRYWPVSGNPLRTVSTTSYTEMAAKGLIDHVVRSTDDGRTWSPPETVPMPYPDGAASAATGNGVHGIQLSSGRLLIQGGYILDGERHICILYSDDHGASWQLGARDQVAGNIREFGMVELDSGAILVNVRSQTGDRRVVGYSRDDGLTFVEFAEHEALPEPHCHAGMVQHSDGTILFSNPAVAHGDLPKGQERRRMTVRLSRDNGVTWPLTRVIWSGPAAYSDLGVLQCGTAFCIYERGEHIPYENIAVARFTLDWLAGAAE